MFSAVGCHSSKVTRRLYKNENDTLNEDEQKYIQNKLIKIFKQQTEAFKLTCVLEAQLDILKGLWTQFANPHLGYTTV